MGGLDWYALDNFIIEYFGVDDVETFIVQLTTIRDRQRSNG